mmetsp:Transcript_34754/g.85071  ORF Transcript_34754/g.85071 Transcript_34754/m.85071 type:complete len:231 (-) Transcript_34754:986-1678(-)
MWRTSCLRMPSSKITRGSTLITPSMVAFISKMPSVNTDTSYVCRASAARSPSAACCRRSTRSMRGGSSPSFVEMSTMIFCSMSNIDSGTISSTVRTKRTSCLLWYSLTDSKSGDAAWLMRSSGTWMVVASFSSTERSFTTDRGCSRMRACMSGKNCRTSRHAYCMSVMMPSATSTSSVAFTVRSMCMSAVRVSLKNCITCSESSTCQYCSTSSSASMRCWILRPASVGSA